MQAHQHGGGADGIGDGGTFAAVSMSIFLRIVKLGSSQSFSSAYSVAVTRSRGRAAEQ
jgi:hypothetical protein